MLEITCAYANENIYIYMFLGQTFVDRVYIYIYIYLSSATKAVCCVGSVEIQVDIYSRRVGLYGLAAIIYLHNITYYTLFLTLKGI